MYLIYEAKTLVMTDLRICISSNVGTYSLHLIDVIIQSQNNSNLVKYSNLTWYNKKCIMIPFCDTLVAPGLQYVFVCNFSSNKTIFIFNML